MFPSFSRVQLIFDEIILADTWTWWTSAKEHVAAESWNECKMIYLPGSFDLTFIIDCSALEHENVG